MKIFYPFLFASILSILQASNFESFEDESYVEDEFFRSLIRDFLDDQKFKKGLITWVKDQFDPDIINAYLKFSEKERQCFLKGMRLVKRTIVEKGFDEAMEFVDNYCPSIYDDAEMFYSWLQNLAHKSIEFIQNFHTDLPESIQAPLKKMGKLSKWIAVDENDEYEDQNVLEIYDVLDQILNATEEDRDALAKKHPFMAPFVTGKLRADSIIIVRTVIKMYKNGSIDNLDSLEVIEAFENWFDGLKQELLEYFSTRQKPGKVLKGGLDRLFTILLGGYYDSLNFDSIADVSQAYEHNKWKWL